LPSANKKRAAATSVHIPLLFIRAIANRDQRRAHDKTSVVTFAQIRFLESQTDHKVEDLIAPHFPGVAGGEIHHGGAEWCDITGRTFVETFSGLIPDALLCMHRSVFATK
jgi:hypothetical protein